MEENRRGGSHFTTQAAWFTHEGFKPFVDGNWDQTLSWENNVKRMTKLLPKWNVNVFGNIRRKKKRLLARINAVDKRLAKRKLQSLIKLEKKLQAELEEVLLQEELL